MHITIRRQKRSSMMMRPVPGGLEVYIPHWLDEKDTRVQQFIEQGRPQLEAHVQPPPPEQTTPQQLREMVATWAARIGVQPKRVQVRQMYQKWGSCSSKGTITLNRALCWLPPELAEYVVVHELVHLLEMSHGQRFEALMTAYIPQWRQRQAAIHQGYSPFGPV